MTDPVTTNVTGWLGGLTAYGPIGIMLAVLTVVGLYVFKRLFDSFMNQLQGFGPQLGTSTGQIIVAVDKLRDEVVAELRELRHELELAQAARPQGLIPENGSGVHAVPPPGRKR